MFWQLFFDFYSRYLTYLTYVYNIVNESLMLKFNVNYIAKFND